MRKIIFILSLSLAFLIFAPTLAFAQTPNTFGCIYQTTCVADTSTETCDANDGYEPDPSYCSSFTNASACSSAPRQQCKFVGLGKAGPAGGGGFFSLQELVAIASPNFVGKSIGDIITSLLSYILAIAGFLLLLYIVSGGFKVLTSRSDPQALSGARSHLTGAIIGFAIILFSFWAIQLVAKILGLQPVIDIFG